jgi:hypothetical protein
MRAALRWPAAMLYGSQFRLARVLLDYVAGIDPSGVELAHALVDLLPRPKRRSP